MKNGEEELKNEEGGQHEEGGQQWPAPTKIQSLRLHAKSSCMVYLERKTPSGEGGRRGELTNSVWQTRMA